MTASHLTPQQARVLDLMTDGLSNKDMARRMGLSPRTIEIHRAKAMRVIGATNSVHAGGLWSKVRQADNRAELATLIAATQHLWSTMALCSTWPTDDLVPPEIRTQLHQASNTVLDQLLTLFPAIPDPEGQPLKAPSSLGEGSGVGAIGSMQLGDNYEVRIALGSAADHLNAVPEARPHPQPLP